ncbi:MAG: Cobyrinate a,c-diamide synthase [Chroococcidiopsis sp. SAG 2025]|nr:Cobyrinate a,c-diamide synthase [Chroococcidiopsis sp. SAG 2025]
MKIVGFVLNRVGSDRHLQLLQDALAPLDLPILGVLRRHDNITIPDRHLGLVPTAELPQLDLVIEQLATLAQTCFDWDKLMPLIQGSREQRVGSRGAEEQNAARGSRGAEGQRGNYQLPITNYQLPNHQFRIAIARDRAFNFYYQDNLDLLQQVGAELVFWSPLTDSGLPENVHGLYFGGGFPEVFAQQLAANTGAIASVKAAILTGMPTYAECGGLMYLCDKIIDFDGNSWTMVGAIPTAATMGSRLTLGYRQAIALQDSPLLQTNDTVWGHEFHRSASELPTQPLFQTQGFSTSPVTEGWRLPNLHASYIHLHFGTRPDIPARFLQHCTCWQESRK